MGTFFWPLYQNSPRSDMVIWENCNKAWSNPDFSYPTHFLGREILSCHQVDLNFHAFLAKSLSLSLSPSAIQTNSVDSEEEAEQVILVKKMQLGLNKALKESSSTATAQISYSGVGGNTVFVVKGGKVFGTVRKEGDTYSLEPCYGHKQQQQQQHCHLWVRYRSKGDRTKIKIWDCSYQNTIYRWVEAVCDIFCSNYWNKRRQYGKAQPQHQLLLSLKQR